MLFGSGRLQASGVNLVETRVNVLRREFAEYEGAPAGRSLDSAIASTVADVVDLDAILGSMEEKRRDLEIETLAKELIERYIDSPTKIESFVGRSARVGPTLSIAFGEAPGELTLAMLTPDGLTDPPERRGLVAHEVSHFEPSVSAKLNSFRRGQAPRGEVLADLFALSILGPAFAWSLSEYSRGTPHWLGSTSHPPMSLRTEIANQSLARVWDEAEVRSWIGRLIQRGRAAMGTVPTAWLGELDESRGDLETAVPRLRALRVHEKSLLSVRGLGDDPRLGSAVSRVNAICPL